MLWAISMLWSSVPERCIGGEGINDAPALAQADAGIAMRGGVAMESTAVILFKGDLIGI